MTSLAIETSLNANERAVLTGLEHEPDPRFFPVLLQPAIVVALFAHAYHVAPRWVYDSAWTVEAITSTFKAILILPALASLHQIDEESEKYQASKTPLTRQKLLDRSRFLFAKKRRLGAEVWCSQLTNLATVVGLFANDATTLGTIATVLVICGIFIRVCARDSAIKVVKAVA